MDTSCTASLPARCRPVLLLSLAVALLVFSSTLRPAQAQQATQENAAQRDLLSQFEDRVTEFTLDNGLTFLIIERHDAPVISFHTYADVGSINEPAGQTGLAHMFEHMAFKGTTTIGTEDIHAEKKLLKQQEDIYLKLRRERSKGPQADSARVRELEEEFKTTTENAKKIIKQNEFDRLLKQAGATGLNASTSSEATRFFYSLPANKMELFFALESDRFRNPVLREFYTERDVVMEERRMRTESTPTGRLIEEFLSTAFKAHPYGEPVIGHMSDLKNISRTQAEAFFKKYYNPSNLTIAIAGDVDPQTARTLAEKYFSRLESGTEPLPITTEEPEQIGERRVTIRESTQPYAVIGYHRPSGQHPDDAAYTVLQQVLSGGRTSRFHKQLVEEKKALAAQAISSFPGDKYPTLFVLFGVPSSGVSPEDIESEMYSILGDIEENGITAEELQRAKTSVRVNLLQGLDSNMGLALQLAAKEAKTGDWRNAFRDLSRVQAVTAQDVQRVAQETFKPSNRTVALIKTTGGEDEEDQPTASAQ